MELNPNKTVAELALEVPALLPVLDDLGIDYCCGGAASLEEACRNAKVTVEQVAKMFEERSTFAHDAERDWLREPLFGLVAFIVNHHHYFTRREMVRLDQLLDKVCAAVERFHEQHGGFWKPAGLLRKLAAEGGRFNPVRGPGAA